MELTWNEAYRSYYSEIWLSAHRRKLTWNEAYRSYYSEIWLYAHRRKSRPRDPEITNDGLQDVAAKFNSKKRRSVRYPLCYWKKTAKNACISILRKLRNQGGLSVDVPDDDPAPPEALVEEEENASKKRIDSLNETHAEEALWNVTDEEEEERVLAFVLTQVCDLEYEAVADLLCIPVPDFQLLARCENAINSLVKNKLIPFFRKAALGSVTIARISMDECIPVTQNRVEEVGRVSQWLTEALKAHGVNIDPNSGCVLSGRLSRCSDSHLLTLYLKVNGNVEEFKQGIGKTPADVLKVWIQSAKRQMEKA